MCLDAHTHAHHLFPFLSLTHTHPTRDTHHAHKDNIMAIFAHIYQNVFLSLCLSVIICVCVFVCVSKYTPDMYPSIHFLLRHRGRFRSGFHQAHPPAHRLCTWSQSPHCGPGALSIWRFEYVCGTYVMEIRIDIYIYRICYI